MGEGGQRRGRQECRRWLESVMRMSMMDRSRGKEGGEKMGRNQKTRSGKTVKLSGGLYRSSSDYLILELQYITSLGSK